jgi:hypothetical protein
MSNDSEHRGDDFDRVTEGVFSPEEVEKMELIGKADRRLITGETRSISQMASETYGPLYLVETPPESRGVLSKAGSFIIRIVNRIGSGK